MVTNTIENSREEKRKRITAKLDLFVHRLGLDLLFAGRAVAAVLLLPLTIGPAIGLDVSNFCCMVCT